MTADVIDLAERRAQLRGEPAARVAEPRAERATQSAVPVLNRCDQPVVSAVCAALAGPDGDQYECGGLLAYQGGMWQHVNACLDCYDTDGTACRAEHTWCDGPEPAQCAHHHCTRIADIGVDYAKGHDRCCGCCWELDDELEGRRLWPN